MNAPAPLPPTDSKNIAKKRLTLIDGSGFIFRAYYATPHLTRADGTPVGAVYGFMNMMLKLMNDRLNDPVEDHVAVIFDAGRYTFRNELYSEYKANRDEAPEDLRPQFALVREATEALSLPAIEMAGFEADDLIASYTRSAQAQEMEVVIVSSDKDLMQLVDDASHVTMFDAMKDRTIDNAAVEEKFGVSPAKVLDVLALMGDASDNIPGVPGIGPKTASQLIAEYGDMESLLTRASEIKQNKRRENLIEFADQARLSYQLVTLKEDIDLPMPLDELILKPSDHDKLLSFVTDMGFKRLIERIGVKAPSGSGESSAASHPPSAPSKDANQTALQGQSTNHTLIQTEAELQHIIMAAHAKGYVSLSLETDAQKLIGVSLAIETGEAAYLPLGHLASAESHGELFEITNPLAAGQLPAEQALEMLKPLLADASVLKIGWRSKADSLLLAQLGLSLTPIDDICLMDYCLNAGSHKHGFADVVARECGTALRAPEELIGKGRSKLSFSQTAYEAALPFAAEKADYTLRLWHYFKPQLFSQKLLTVHERLERSLVPVLAQMEQNGILVERARLQKLTAEFNIEITRLAQEIHQLAGREFLIGSPKQLGEILFDEMSIEGGKKSKKSGQYSTGVEVLEELAASGHTIAEKVLEWRQYEKLRSTYTDALEKQINVQTGRVHTTFQQTVAATGRLSSTDPNLQNIPIRSEQGKRIRKAFVAAEGYSLFAADYSQIELRLLAEMADIGVLKQAFKDKLDIHAATASQMFGVPLDEMTADLRRNAKMINFGIIYGISAHGLAMRLGIERAEAAQFIKAYFEHYPGIRTYMEAKKLEAKENGYITTLYGRKVHIAGINDKNGMRRAFGERQAINAPLQGTAADIIKRAMVQVSNQLSVVSRQSSKNSPQGEDAECRMLLQVHDELVFEIKQGFEEIYAPKIQKIMENAAHLSVPLVVETGLGHDWGEIH